MDKQQRRIVLGDVLARFRLGQEMSQAEVATALGKPQSYVSKYEAARRRLELQDIEEIADALGVPLDQILEVYMDSIR